MSKPEKRSNAKRANRPNPREDRNIRDRTFHNTTIGSTEPKVRKKVELLPRNLRQEEYIDLLSDDRKDIVFAIGPAGTGKTYVSALYALKCYLDGKYSKIIITRPAVSTEEKHGFLPGDINRKMEPWVKPILSVFEEFIPLHRIETMLENGDLEIAPMAFLRGRSFKDSIVLADEMQNSLPGQMKTLLTRIGENCKMIIDGDMAQHDRSFEINGLRDFIDRLESKGSSSISICRFGKGDIERHPVIGEILSLYGEE